MYNSLMVFSVVNALSVASLISGYLLVGDRYDQVGNDSETKSQIITFSFRSPGSSNHPQSGASDPFDLVDGAYE